MLTIGRTNHKLVCPADRIRDRWLTEFQENRQFIAEKVADYIVSSLLPEFYHFHNVTYCESPRSQDPYRFKQQVTTHLVCSLIPKTDPDRPKAAPFSEWSKQFKRRVEIDTAFFSGILKSLCTTAAELVIPKLEIKFREDQFSNVRFISRFSKVDRGNGVATKVWIKKGGGFPKTSCNEEAKWTKQFNKHVAATAGKIGLHIQNQIKQDLEHRLSDPYALDHSKEVVLTYSLHLWSVLNLIKRVLPEEQILSPFDRWLELKNGGEFPENTDFRYFKDKIMQLALEIDVWLKKQKKSLKAEGIQISSAFDGKQLAYHVHYHDSASSHNIEI